MHSLIDFSDRLKDLAFKSRMTRDSDHGKSLMYKVLPELTERIEDVRLKYTNVSSKPAFITCVEDLEPALISGIVLITCLDNLLESISQVSLAYRVGEYLNQEINFRTYSATKEGLAVIQRSQKKYRNHRSKRAINEAAIKGEMGDIEIVEWTPQIRRSIGFVYLRLLEDMGLIDKVTPKKSLHYRWAEHVQQWAADSFEFFVHYTPNYTPLLVPPQPWVQDEPNSSYGEHFPPVQFRLKSRASERKGLNGTNMSTADLLGAVPYTINRTVFDAVLQLWSEGHEIGNLVSSAPMEFAPYPVDGDDEMKLDWNKDATKVYTYNQQTHGRRLYYMRTWAILKAYAELDEFYFMWVSDSRGRLYPLTSTLLSPQGSDLGKSLLMFRDKKPLGERGLYHLYCAVAEYYGVDKVSITDRYQWAVNNLGMVLQIGMTHARELWQDADSPFQFLAACIELYNALQLDDPTQYECGLAKFMDGKCSGAQHWAMLLKDEDVGASVGLTPSLESDAPPDLYSEVLNTWMQGLITKRWDNTDHPEWADWASGLALSGVMSRAWTKAPVMTYLYGSKLITWSRYITEQLRIVYKEDDTARRGYWLASCLSHVLKERLSSVVRGMGWLTSAAKVISHAGYSTIQFTSTSGFEVNQGYRKCQTTQQKIQCLVFNTPIKYSLSKETDELDKTKQSGAISPNFIHCQDAAHLSESVVMCGVMGLQMHVIHDSFGTHMCDVDLMADLVKQRMISMYRDDVLTGLKDEWESKYHVVLPELPTPGVLDIDGLAGSTYAFSG